MAGDWIKMSTDLRTHPKVVRIASAMKADRLRVVGGLHAVWCLFDAHSEDGTLSGYTLDALDDLVGWPGFSAALCDVQWLLHSNDSLELPRFDAHNGASAKRRAQEAERKRLARADGPQDVGETSASNADKKRTREEKRREEKKDSGAKAPSSARPSRKCPEGFEPEEPQAWISEHCPGVDWQTETAKFRDHTFAASRTDWQGAWRNWMRKSAEMRPNARGSPIVGKQAALEARNRSVIDEYMRETQ